jgi:hypothetical protein
MWTIEGHLIKQAQVLLHFLYAIELWKLEMSSYLKVYKRCAESKLMDREKSNIFTLFILFES